MTHLPVRMQMLMSPPFGGVHHGTLLTTDLLVLFLLFCGIFGPLIAPWPYQAQDLQAVFANGGRPLPPLSPNHILGTDQLGRDLLSRLLDGARISVTVARARRSSAEICAAARRCWTS